MPRVPEYLLRSVVYIYLTKQDARENERYGGTGFLVGVSGIAGDDWDEFRAPNFFYVVTAAHVVVGKGSRVLRINTVAGFETLTLEEQDWYWQEEGGRPKNDLAVCPIDISSYGPSGLDVSVIPITTALSRDYPAVAPGEDVVMIGRFVDHGGQKRNQPALRFGILSMMPSDPIPSDTGHELVAFLVEMRSRGGHSGSPVIAYWDEFRNPPLRVDPMRPPRPGVSVEGSRPVESHALLGIDQGQFLTYLDLVDKAGTTITAMKVKERSAMSVVIPSWCLADLLKDERLVETRRRLTEKHDQAPEAAADSDEV